MNFNNISEIFIYDKIKYDLNLKYIDFFNHDTLFYIFEDNRQNMRQSIIYADHTSGEDITTVSSDFVLTNENGNNSLLLINNSIDYNMSKKSTNKLNSIINYKNYYSQDFISNRNILDITDIVNIIDGDKFFIDNSDSQKSANSLKIIDGIFIYKNKMLITNINNIKNNIIFYEYFPYINGDISDVFIETNTFDATGYISNIYPLYLNLVFKLFNNSFERYIETVKYLKCTTNFEVRRAFNMNFLFNSDFNGSDIGYPPLEESYKLFMDSTEILSGEVDAVSGQNITLYPNHSYSIEQFAKNDIENYNYVYEYEQMLSLRVLDNDVSVIDKKYLLSEITLKFEDQNNNAVNTINDSTIDIDELLLKIKVNVVNFEKFIILIDTKDKIFSKNEEEFINRYGNIYFKFENAENSLISFTIPKRIRFK